MDASSHTLCTDFWLVTRAILNVPGVFRNVPGHLSDQVRYLKTSEAAALLNVSPNTLRAWERRFGFPKPQRSPGKHRLFTHGEIAALRDALQEGLSISSAVSRAREGLAADANSLVGALVSYEGERADAAIEAALALRTVERSVEEVLLPTLDEILRRYGSESAAWAFASHWAADWLRRATRLSPPPVRPVSIVFGDATRDELDPDSPYLRALELFCVRAGIDVLSLSARGVAGIGDAVAVHRPNLVVVAGSHLDDDAVARWAYAIRLAGGAVPVAVYRRGSDRGRVRSTGTRNLPPGAGAAQRRILELIEGELLAVVAPPSKSNTVAPPRSASA
ncbi:MAG TPA: MerR family DNA-binding transcriptional regulator [Solirubrobacteraceae bacterium]|nr:MerR family DNA-binding transcriptional regulator [Solirubrobacteraceae bacterium]